MFRPGPAVSGRNRLLRMTVYVEPSNEEEGMVFVSGRFIRPFLACFNHPCLIAQARRQGGVSGLNPPDTVKKKIFRSVSGTNPLMKVLNWVPKMN